MNSFSLALKKAFPHTLPILAGYGFLGLAYGIYMASQGFSPIYPFLMALVIYGGSLEYVTASLLTMTFDPLQGFLLAMIIQARHIFYGLAMLKKYRGMGASKPYLIFALTDETFAVNYSAQLPEGIRPRQFYLSVSILNQIYWVLGAGIGGILGNAVSFNTHGLDFIMTTMFLVILLDQLRKEKHHDSAILGLLISCLCLRIFGSSSFLIPTMLLLIVALLLLRPVLEPRLSGSEAQIEVEKYEEREL